SSTPGYRINGIKREELIAANSAFLHELYFQTLGAGDSLKPGGLSVAFSRDFGSFERWCNEFSAIGKALAGGSGWVLCSWSTQENPALPGRHGVLPRGSKNGRLRCQQSQSSSIASTATR